VRSWILVNPTSIGDTWCVFAFVRAFKAAHGGPVTMVVKQSQAAIAEMFPGDADRLIVWEDKRLSGFVGRIDGQGSFDLDEPIIAHPDFQYNRRNIYKLLDLFRFPGRGGVTLADQYRLMLRLDWEAPLSKPVVPDAWRAEAGAYAAEIGLEPGRSVILFPDNNSVSPLPTAFWQSLADELRALGYKVFTNLAGNQQGPRTEPLAGTCGIGMTIRNAVPLVEMAGRFISMSNGMAAMLVGVGAKAEHSLLLQLPPAGEILQITGIPVPDPLVVQTQRYVGFSDGPFNEYAIRPDEDYAAIVKDVARNAPASAVTWR
jgi:hypothetical protein